MHPSDLPLVMIWKIWLRNLRDRFLLLDLSDVPDMLEPDLSYYYATKVAWLPYLSHRPQTGAIVT